MEEVDAIVIIITLIIMSWKMKSVVVAAVDSYDYLCQMMLMIMTIVVMMMVIRIWNLRLSKLQTIFRFIITFLFDRRQHLQLHLPLLLDQTSSSLVFLSVISLFVTPHISMMWVMINLCFGWNERRRRTTRKKCWRWWKSWFWPLYQK